VNGSPTHCSIAELVPHAGEAILLDRLLDCGDENVSTEVTIRPGLYSDADGHLPGWMGLELMAQSVAAWAGVQAKRARQPVQPGFLIGTRHYACNVPVFPQGSQLQIEGRCSLQDASGLGVFECTLSGSGRHAHIHAHARLNVFRPPEVARYLHEPVSSNQDTHP